MNEAEARVMRMVYALEEQLNVGHMHRDTGGTPVPGRKAVPPVIGSDIVGRVTQLVDRFNQLAKVLGHEELGIH